MRFILLILFPLSALADCHQFLLKGKVKLEGKEIVLVVNEDTRSQKLYPALYENESQLGPYLNSFISGKFVLEDESPLSGSKLLAISDVELAVPDPLTREGEWRPVQKVSCPVRKKKAP